MKLYSGDLSPYSAKVRMQIYAKGIDSVTLERPAGFGTEAWWKTSPIGRIPVLELDDGQLIPELEVIAEYLEDTFPTPRLLGATPLSWRASAPCRGWPTSTCSTTCSCWLAKPAARPATKGRSISSRAKLSAA